MSDEQVELRPAFEWTCPDCGTDHFLRGMVPELDEDDEREAKASLGYEPWDEGCLMCAPEPVTCPDCNQSFPTVDFRADSSD